MSKMFFGGVPTALDVRKLQEAFPALSPGDEIEHEQIEAVIEVDRASSRYRTVTNAWRKHLLTDANIDIGAISGVGFRVLLDHERISTSVKGFQSGVRKQIRCVKRAILVRTDDEILRRKQEVMNRLGIAIASQATTMMREIEPPKRTQGLPKPDQPGV
jgi:hypothetical protein